MSEIRFYKGKQALLKIGNIGSNKVCDYFTLEPGQLKCFELYIIPYRICHKNRKVVKKNE